MKIRMEIKKLCTTDDLNKIVILELFACMKKLKR